MIQPISYGETAIRIASTLADIGDARTLFVEYVTWLNVDLCFQGIEEELATLPGAYAPPRGCLLLAGGGETSDPAAGCVAVRTLPYDPDGRSSELKRLWVRPEYRGRRIGHALTAAALDAARALGYRTIKLDTLPHLMPNAVAMYRSFSFTECEPYYRNPIPGCLYMECLL